MIKTATKESAVMDEPAQLSTEGSSGSTVELPQIQEEPLLEESQCKIPFYFVLSTLTHNNRYRGNDGASRMCCWSNLWEAIDPNQFSKRWQSYIWNLRDFFSSRTVATQGTQMYGFDGVFISYSKIIYDNLALESMMENLSLEGAIQEILSQSSIKGQPGNAEKVSHEPSEPPVIPEKAQLDEPQRI